MKKGLLLLLLCWWPIVRGHAQGLEVVSTTPAHGSAGVDPATAVSFTFSQALALDSLVIFPLDTLIQQQLTDPSRVIFSPDGKTVTFNVTHQADRDYTWVVHFAKGTDGSRLTRRYVLHYTTAATSGPHTVSGQLIELTQEPGKQYTLSGLPRFSTFRRPLAMPSEASASLTKAPYPPVSVSPAPPRLASTQSSHLGNWYVALFPTENPDDSDPVRVAVSNSDGTFAIEYVRPGTYYLWAFNFGFNFEEPIGAGAYDPNGDGQPDSIQVSGDVTGLNVPVFLFTPMTALQAAQVAQLALLQVASDAQIVLLTGSPDDNGQALTWSFFAYSPSQQTAYTLTTTGQNPGPVQTLPSPAPYDQMDPLPLDNMVDSDVIANTYRGQYPSTGSGQFLFYAGQLAPYFDALGQLPLSLYPLDPAQPIWLVQEYRPLPAPVQGMLEVDVAYDLNGNALATYEPTTASGALTAAWEQVAPAKRIQQSDGIVAFRADSFDPYSGKASYWTVDLFVSGQALRLQLSNTLVVNIDTLNQSDWANAPKIPFPDIVDSDQAADTARAHHAANFLENHANETVFAWLEGGFLAEQYGLQIDPSTPLYALTLAAYAPQAGKRAPAIAQTFATYFVNMSTGTFIGAEERTAPGPFTARAHLQAISDSAAQRHPGAELKRLFADGVGPDGRAWSWTYDFYQSEGNTQVQVQVSESDEGLAFTWTPSSPPVDPVDTWPTLPASFVDSDTAMATAMANGGSQFIAEHAYVIISMEGRAMPDRYPHLEGHFIWEIIFRAGIPNKRTHSLTQADSLVVLVDMETGEVLPTSVAREDLPGVPRLALKSIYPNPAARTAIVVVHVPRPERIRLTVYNLLGQEVARLIDGPITAGEHRLRWSVHTLPAGLYLLRLQGADGIQTLPVVVAH